MSSASAGRPALGEPQPHPTISGCSRYTCWSCGHCAIAEPLYQVLGRNREFYVRPRVGLIDLLLFIGLVSLLCPLCAGALRSCRRRLIPRIASYVRLALLAC